MQILYLHSQSKMPSFYAANYLLDSISYILPHLERKFKYQPTNE